jgi:hypothetical protein
MDRAKDHDTQQSRTFARSHARHSAREAVALA